MKRGLLIVAVGSVALAQGVMLPAEIRGYSAWKRANPNKIATAGAHPALKDVYYNPTVERARQGAAFPAAHPAGSVYVKERTDPDTLTVTTLYTMRKQPGFDARNNNWQYGVWEREGATFRGSWMTAQGGASCAGCHARARAQDYVFLNYLK